ncbi:unnamed protein product, partial [Mesorhabditis belari]|uniref:ABC-type xenobiotic transporter n=1 Tax=Mesorhabditis belari TaxID=2138241 RepID=A0AAF3FIB8_9BILA
MVNDKKGTKIEVEFDKERDENGMTKDAQEEEEEKPPQKVPLRKLFRYLTKLDFCLLMLGLGVSACTGVGLPLMAILQGNIGQSFIDEEIYLKNNYSVPMDDSFTEDVFKDRIMKVVYQYAGLTVGIFIAAYLQVSCLLVVCERMNDRLRRKFFEAILRQDIAFFDKNQGGTMATKLFDSLERVREGTGDKLGLMIQFLSQFVTGFVVAFAHNWKLTLIMLGFTPFQVVCGFLISRSMTTLTLLETIKYSKAGKVAEEVISSIRTVVAFNGLNRESKRYSEALSEARRMGIYKAASIGGSFGAMQLTNFSSFALAFYIGVNWVHNGEITPGELLTVFFSVMMGSMALGQSGPQIAVLGAAASIFEVLDRTPEIDSQSEAGKKGGAMKGKIEFNDVRFSYPTRPDVQVLKGLRFNVEPGQTVALVGSSGCGKSSVVNLLLRYYDAENGSILIDGTPINELNIAYLREQIAVVSQEPVLFNCSIEENIRFGREDIDQKTLGQACRAANAEVFIKRLPQGYSTFVGDRGTQLSGGQKQRIAIARALVRNPRILLLDEATSALDAESEGLVQKALEKASEGRTTIIIAHRLSTIRNADKIIAIKEGEVIEEGSHDELIQQKGLYYDLIQAQTFADTIDNVESKEELPVSRNYRRESSTVPSLRHRSSTVQSSVINEVMENNEVNEKKDDLSRLKREIDEVGAEKTNLLEILHFASKERIWLCIGMIGVIIGGFVFPAYSIFFTQMLDIFTLPPADLLHKGHIWALLFLVLAIAQAFSVLTHVFFFGLGSELMTQRLRATIFTNVLSQEIGYFDSPLHATGKICTRLATDVPNLKSAMDFRLSTVLATIVSCVTGVGVAFFFGWQMALLSVGLYPLLGIGQAFRTRIMQGKHRQTAKDLENSGKVAMEAIENIKTVQALTRERTFYQMFCSFLDEPHKEALKQATVQGAVYGFASCAIYLLNCISYRFGLFLILERTLSPMDVLRVMYAVSISTTTVGFATSYFPEYMKARFAGGIIFSMLRERSNMDNLSTKGLRNKVTGSVAFEDVHFSYPQRSAVSILKGLSLSVSPGETLALVGPSGSGKSTVVALLERFYDVTKGVIKLDGVDIREMNPDHLRSQMALVSQEPILFDCSIRKNIAYGVDGEITDQEIIEAAKKANIHNFISNLPQGYETRVGDKGTQLSGGQKQRIAIARALIRNPKILLLDEATSALDTESEKIVQEALDRARSGRTCIVIAHRLSTIINADRIAVVQSGKLVEQGTHQELLALHGVYYDLTKKQNLH